VCGLAAGCGLRAAVAGCGCAGLVGLRRRRRVLEQELDAGDHVGGVGAGGYCRGHATQVGVLCLLHDVAQVAHVAHVDAVHKMQPCPGYHTSALRDGFRVRGVHASEVPSMK